MPSATAPIEPRDSRRTAVREFKRRLIQDAAKQIFADHGIEAASMREIALAAGYSTGLIYAYFETKEELYAEILRDSLDALYEAMVAATGSKTWIGRSSAFTSARISGPPPHTPSRLIELQ